MNAKIIIGAQFGDEGKGLGTDYLCSIMPEDTIAIRFSGGQQAGHTVIRDKVKHVYSNFCSGNSLGCPSYFTEHTTIYPKTIASEQIILREKGLPYEGLSVHPLAKITTPYDVAWNRWQEQKVRHGSVGLGIGATMKRNITTGYHFYAMDWMHSKVAFEKLMAVKSYYLGLVNDRAFEELYSGDEDLFIKLMERKDLFKVRDYDYLKGYTNLVFEGSQGIGLDMDHGFFPNVTFANTTSKNAVEVCRKLDITDPSIFYMTRCYQTRHGNGWMSNHDKEIELVNTKEEINVKGDWQGEFRIREIDYDMLNYSLDVDNIYSKGLNKNLFVTCLDQRPQFKFEYERLNNYFCRVFNSYSPSGDGIVRNKMFV